MNTGSQDIGERRVAERRGAPFRAGLMAVFIFYVAAALLNGRHLYEDASRRSYGPAREAWMGALRPLARISERWGLDRLRAVCEIDHSGEGL